MPRAKAVDKLNYEQAFGELETVVERLGTGDLPLEEALALFEKGQALATRCSELLEQAELKLRQLVPDESGGYVEIDLEGDEEK
ncbi:MAG: exodeoxyribonuclease VII small subunit [Anaerolineales bacterium]|nr:exodeoxyribonuclease VII small subunit [Anaerolineales bacterium]